MVGPFLISCPSPGEPSNNLEGRHAISRKLGGGGMGSRAHADKLTKQARSAVLTHSPTHEADPGAANRRRVAASVLAVVRLRLRGGACAEVLAARGGGEA